MKNDRSVTFLGQSIIRRYDIIRSLKSFELGLLCNHHGGKKILVLVHSSHKEDKRQKGRTEMIQPKPSSG